MKPPEAVVRHLTDARSPLLTSHAQVRTATRSAPSSASRAILRSSARACGVEPRPDATDLPCRCPARTASTSARCRRPASPPTSTWSSRSSAPASTAPGSRTTSSAPVVNIDHHLGNQHYGVVNWVDPTRRRSGEMLTELAQGWRPSTRRPPTASPDGLVTDTGGFRFANATAGGLRRRGGAGARRRRPNEVSQWLYESRRRGLAAPARGAARHARAPRRRPRRHACTSSARCSRAPAPAGDTEGLVDYPRSIAGVKAVALLREVDDGGMVQGLAAQPGRGRRRADRPRARRRRPPQRRRLTGDGAARGGEARSRDARRPSCAELGRGVPEGGRRMTSDGLLLVDKEPGCTSHDVVQRCAGSCARSGSATAARSTRTPPACWCSPWARRRGSPAS
jgi:hypothetical protein